MSRRRSTGSPLAVLLTACIAVWLLGRPLRSWLSRPSPLPVLPGAGAASARAEPYNAAAYQPDPLEVALAIVNHEVVGGACTAAMSLNDMIYLCLMIESHESSEDWCVPFQGNT